MLVLGRGEETKAINNYSLDVPSDIIIYASLYVI